MTGYDPRTLYKLQIAKATMESALQLIEATLHEGPYMESNIPIVNEMLEDALHILKKLQIDK